jgi:predicted ABC-type exoprotein transport system permease subunit
MPYLILMILFSLTVYFVHPRISFLSALFSFCFVLHVCRPIFISVGRTVTGMSLMCFHIVLTIRIWFLSLFFVFLSPSLSLLCCLIFIRIGESVKKSRIKGSFIHFNTTSVITSIVLHWRKTVPEWQ